MRYLCSGCGACVAICSKQCMELKENDEGFYQASINKKLCNNCKLCEMVCPLERVPNTIVYASGYYYTNSIIDRLSSSSGGICNDLIHSIDLEKYRAVGAVYDLEKNNVHHISVSNLKECEKFKGSKYLQSNPMNIYDAVEKNNCIIFGTPCQISGVRKYIELKKLKYNYYFIDFYCHGIPSYFLWRKYLKELHLEKKWKEVNFRDKKIYGWKDYCLSFLDDKQKRISSLKNDNDFFYQAFLSNLCLNKCCYQKCPFHGEKSDADIRVGDAWGYDGIDDNKGVSLAICFSQKGEKMLGELNKLGNFMPRKLETIVTGQIRKSLIEPKARDAFIKELANDYMGIKRLNFKYLLPQKIKKSLSVRLRKYKK